MGKKSILMVMPWLPYPLVSGGHQALFNGMMAIHQDYDISLAFIVEDEYEYLEALKGFTAELPDVKLFPFYDSKRIAEGAKRRRKKRPWYNILFHQVFNRKCLRVQPFNKVEWWRLCSLPPRVEWIAHVQSLLDSNAYDLVQIEMPWLLNLMFGLRSTAKLAFVHHELGFIRRALEMQDTPKDDVTAWTWMRIADFVEINLLNRCDAVITLSPVDAIKLSDAGVTTRLFSSKAVVEIPSASAESCEKTYAVTRRLTFMGPDEHAPNYEGLMWFLENCWKQLKEKDAAYTLDIIGRWSREGKKAIRSRYCDVNFLDYVEDLSEALDGSIMIVPINIGSGIRMKILEAMARGVPFVSTPVGAEGIPVEDGKHCFITDDPSAFVQDILLLQDASLQERFAEASRRVIEETYSLETLRQNRLEIYDSILAL